MKNAYCTFFFLLCWLFLIKTKALSQQVNISGTCWDLATGVDLKVKITATVNGQQLSVGESEDTGKFDLAIPVSATNLTFEAKGYRTITKPLHIESNVEKADRFIFSFKMIALDSQQVVRAAAVVPGGQSGESPKANFEVRDAYLGKILTAKICMTFPRTGRSYCLDTDSTSAPSVSFVGELENIDIKVTSEGFDDYEGKLKTVTSSSGEIFYQIKLLKSVSNLAVFAFYTPENLHVDYKTGGVHLPYFKGKPWTNIAIDHLIGKHSLTASVAGGGQVLSEHPYTIRQGLNLISIRVKAPESNLDQITVTAKATPRRITSKSLSDMALLLRTFDSITLYFDQSSYILRPDTKLTLDSISEFFLKQTNLKAQITGHTDNVGNRNLNVLLSEHRARVVAHYLKQKGVQPDKITLKWAGPDAPVLTNDREDNKAKNRRVVVKVINVSQ